MNIKNNPPRRTALVWTGVIVIGIFIIFLPGMIGLEGFRGGYALSFGGCFMAIIGLIAAIIYARIGLVLDSITKKEHILAYWTYTYEEWKSYTEEENKEDSQSKKLLFIIVAIISIIVGIIFYAIVRDDALIIVLITVGIIILVGLTALLSSLSSFRHIKRSPCEAIIAMDGVYLNHVLHIWKGIGNQLEEAVYELDKKSRPRVRFEYSSPSNEGRNTYTAQIPVPPGQEDLARKIVAEIKAVHLSK
jgi:hypothetical protein